MVTNSERCDFCKKKEDLVSFCSSLGEKICVSCWESDKLLPVECHITAPKFKMRTHERKRIKSASPVCSREQNNNNDRKVFCLRKRVHESMMFPIDMYCKRGKLRSLSI